MWPIEKGNTGEARQAQDDADLRAKAAEQQAMHTGTSSSSAAGPSGPVDDDPKALEEKAIQL